LNLAIDTVLRSSNNEPVEVYLQMDSAARLSRDRQSVRMTDIRGPHSPALEMFLEKYVRNYDIVVTHNSVLRPAVAAISAAKAADVPSVLIPHAHLDDDFYHFPDVRQCALEADLILAAPKAACVFYERIGVRRAEYLPAGVDTSEVGSDADESLFRTIYTRSTPFFLVLGRKSGAKGYLHVIREVELLAKKRSVHLVLIGPDDDGVPVTSMHASYLGYQPTGVVRGALKACIGLINMSSSESFGMVLLESWLAGRPVIANAACPAFRDLAVHEKNALLVSVETLGAALERLASDNFLCDRLGTAGRTIADQYAWDKICSDFVDKCSELLIKR
jgi:glycosyltransferase involved in cell wall biosynthesis